MHCLSWNHKFVGAKRDLIDSDLGLYIVFSLEIRFN